MVRLPGVLEVRADQVVVAVAKIRGLEVPLRREIKAAWEIKVVMA